MKYLSITMLILCIHVAMSMFNAAGIFHTSLQPDTEWFDDLTAVKDDKFSQAQVEDLSAFDASVGFIKALFYFFTYLAIGIVIVPYTMTAFGIPLILAVPLSIPVYLIYVVAIAQWFGNRSAKGMM